MFEIRIDLNIPFPFQRPTAGELLQHRFIRGARKTSYLTELIERYDDFRSRASSKAGVNQQQSALALSQQQQQTWGRNSTLRSEWSFDTMKSSTSAMGSFKSTAKDLMRMPLPPGMREDPENTSDEEEGLPPIEESDDVYDSVPVMRSTSGAYPPGRMGHGVGFNVNAAHSTVLIKPVPPILDVPGLVPSEDESSPENSAEGLATPPAQDDVATATVLENNRLNAALGAPPAYQQTGSVRSKKRSSYAERNSIQGTIMREADLGTGVDTIRPVKKVDAAGSLRLSAEFVGMPSGRKDGTTDSGSMPGSPTQSRMDPIHKRSGSDAAKAGRAMVDQVLVPTLNNACLHCDLPRVIADMLD